MYERYNGNGIMPKKNNIQCEIKTLTTFDEVQKEDSSKDSNNKNLHCRRLLNYAFSSSYNVQLQVPSYIYI